MYTIYVLRCRNGKFYVGKSSNYQRRVSQHQDGLGTYWTMLHKPVDVLRVVPEEYPGHEDYVTKETMAQYGTDNVRGGSYCQVVLPTSTRTFLEQEIRSMQNTCFRCGGHGHYYQHCQTKASTHDVAISVRVRATEALSTSSVGDAATCWKLLLSPDHARQVATLKATHNSSQFKFGDHLVDVLECAYDPDLFAPDLANYVIVQTQASRIVQPILPNVYVVEIVK